MCRLCGRVVKCIFDSMPSRVSSSATTARSFSTAVRGRSIHNGSSHITSRSLVRSALDIKSRDFVAAPTFLLPFRARLHQATTTQQAAPTNASASFDGQDSIPPSILEQARPQSASSQSTSTTTVASTRPTLDKPLVLSKSLQQLLPLLSTQTPHYITTHIHRFPYLVQAGDTLRLPFVMSGVSSGDVLRLNRASLLGSRDYTLKAGTSSTELYDRHRTGEPNYLDERLFEVRARVLGIESGPMFKKEKTKRRNRKVKTVKSKHRYTMLKIMEVKVKTLNELMAGKGTVLLES